MKRQQRRSSDRDAAFSPLAVTCEASMQETLASMLTISAVRSEMMMSSHSTTSKMASTPSYLTHSSIPTETTLTVDSDVATQLTRLRQSKSSEMTMSSHSTTSKMASTLSPLTPSSIPMETTLIADSVVVTQLTKLRKSKSSEMTTRAHSTTSKMDSTPS